MFKFNKSELIKSTIAQVLLVMAVLALLFAVAANNNHQDQAFEPAIVPGEEIIPASLIEQIPAESKLAFWYARAYGNDADDAQLEVIPASLLEQIPAESKLAFWYAREYSNGSVQAQTGIVPASLLEQIPAESKLEFWYARAYGNG